MSRKRQTSSFFVGKAPSLPEFGTGEAAEILDVPIWRLQKFLDSKQYNLSPAGKLGHGRGSRRVFSEEDLHRIALATWLVKDGFAPQFVGAVVRQIEDSDLDVYIGHEGEEAPLSLVFQRGKDGPVVRICTTKKAETISEAYYRVDLNEVFAEVDARIVRLHQSQ
jgi:DNA-binding transcriptional MerR regulator